MAYSPEAIQAGPQVDLRAPEIIMDYEGQGMSGPQVKLHYKELDLTPDQAMILFETKPVTLPKPKVELEGQTIFNRLTHIRTKLGSIIT